MSETEITMSEKETPIIHISGTLTMKDYMAALRAGGLRFFPDRVGNLSADDAAYPPGNEPAQMVSVF